MKQTVDSHLGIFYKWLLQKNFVLEVRIQFPRENFLAKRLWLPRYFTRKYLARGFLCHLRYIAHPQKLRILRRNMHRDVARKYFKLLII